MNLACRDTNLNRLWAGLLMEELTRQGVGCFFLASGSRSSPLIAAAAAAGTAPAVVHMDERGVGFCALGWALASGRPAACITTSGTAAVNLWPAVVEASQSRVPLILLTADRPPELRGTGANQTIDQQQIFGSYARWWMDVPCPDLAVPPSRPLEIAATAFAHACGREPGPVHLNCMFREPLDPAPDGRDYRAYVADIQPWITSASPYRQPAACAENDAGNVPGLLQSQERGLVIAGTLGRDSERNAAATLARLLGWPLLPDVTSGLRLGSGCAERIAFYDQILLSKEWRKRHRPAAILHAGGPLVSRRLLDFLAESQPGLYVTAGRPRRPFDPGRLVTHRVEMDLESLAEKLGGRHAANSEWLESWLAADRLIDRELGIWFGGDRPVDEAVLARVVSESLADDTPLILACSMPVRDMDMYGASGGSRARVFSNRGASGIDGTVSTAAGVAMASGRHAVLLIGDLALLHDLNGLNLLRRQDANVTIVLINNNGGGIFHFLPIAQTAPDFETYWGTPHGLTFRPAAELFGLAYGSASSPAQLVAELRQSFARGGSTLIEVRTDRADNLTAHRALQDHLRRALEGRPQHTP